MKVAVIGAGVGGLAVAMRRAALGDDVHVFEQSPHLGGKLQGYERDGFHFETGPSLLTWPSEFEELFASVGSDLHQHVRLRRLDPVCRYRFPSGEQLDLRAELQDTVDEVDRFSPGSGRAWREFCEASLRTWNVAQRTFLGSPLRPLPATLVRLRHLKDVRDIDGMRSLSTLASSTFDDRRLQHVVERFATYSGSDPGQVPATLRCIAAVEQYLGAWYVDGGLPVLAQAMVHQARTLGVQFSSDTNVDRIEVRHGRVVGIEVDGASIPFDVVISNADAEHLYSDLLLDQRRLRRVQRAHRSSAAFVLLIGVRGITDQLAHHNVAFSSEYRREFADIFGRAEPPGDPTVYVCCSSKSDPSQAPLGHENWFVLVNVPSTVEIDETMYTELVLGVVQKRFDLHSDRIVFVESRSPKWYERSTRSPGGAIYGTSSNGRLAAFLRPDVRGPASGLYLCGGSVHPGGGLPMVTRSARLASDAITIDLAQQ